MLIWIKNFLRKLTNQPKIRKTGNATVQIRYVVEPWKCYNAKIVKAKNFNPKFNRNCFRVYTSNEVIFAPTLIISGAKITELLYSDRIFFREQWYDPKNNTYFWGRWGKL